MYKLPEPWLSFLRELDGQLREPIAMACMGGFAVTTYYGLVRSTVDIDAWSVGPEGISSHLESLSAYGSPLNLKHRVYIQLVPKILTLPCDHEDRLIQLETPELNNITLHVLEAHDLALSKLERNDARDRQDVVYLAEAGHINAKTLMNRYFEEQRMYMIGDLKVYDNRLNLWLSLCWPQEFPD